MQKRLVPKPIPEELTGYMKTYVDEVVEKDLMEALSNSLDQSMKLYLEIDAAREEYRYAEGKWSIKEVLSHVVDTERIFGYRALTFARGDSSPLPGFEENDYVPNSNASARTLTEIINEYEIVRKGTMELFCSFNDEMLDRKGTANNLTLTPRILGWMLTGHDVHHRRVVAEKYLGKAIVLVRISA